MSDKTKLILISTLVDVVVEVEVEEQSIIIFFAKKSIAKLSPSSSSSLIGALVLLYQASQPVTQPLAGKEDFQLHLTKCTDN